MKDAKLLSPSEAQSEINNMVPYLMKSVVGLFGLTDDGRVIAKGTGTLVSIEHQRFIFTAKHVVAGTIGAGLPTRLCLFPLGTNGQAVMRLFLPPEIIDVSPSRIVWMDVGFDVAALSIPELATLPAERFIEGAFHAQITREKTKYLWREFSLDGGFLPFMVCGFPNFGDAVDFKNRSQILSCSPAIAEVSTWDESHWIPGAESPPQCYFDLSTIDSFPNAHNLNPWELHLEQTARLATSEVNNEAFGGMSGGPVFCITGEGCFLSAIVKEGGRMFGAVRIIASSWDDVFFAFLHGSSSSFPSRA